MLLYIITSNCANRPCIHINWDCFVDRELFFPRMSKCTIESTCTKYCNRSQSVFSLRAFDSRYDLWSWKNNVHSRVEHHFSESNVFDVFYLALKECCFLQQQQKYFRMFEEQLPSSVRANKGVILFGLLRKRPQFSVHSQHCQHNPEPILWVIATTYNIIKSVLMLSH